MFKQVADSLGQSSKRALSYIVPQRDKTTPDALAARLSNTYKVSHWRVSSLEEKCKGSEEITKGMQACSILSKLEGRCWQRN